MTHFQNYISKHALKSFPVEIIYGYLSYSRMPKTESVPAIFASFQKWHEEITTYKDEVEDVGARAQEILDENHVSSRMGCQATQLTSRYQALLLQVLVSEPPATRYRPAYFTSQNVLPVISFQ